MHITLNLVVTYWLLVIGCFQSFKYGKGTHNIRASWKRQFSLYGLVLIYLAFSAFLSEDGLVMLLMYSGIVLCFTFWPLSFLLGKRLSKDG